MILWGPPFNRNLEEIGWMTRSKITKLALSHRDSKGILDLDMIKAQEKAEEEKSREKEPIDIYEQYRSMRRQQAVPEYLIDKEIKRMEEHHAFIRKQREQQRAQHHNYKNYSSTETASNQS